jgi:flagellar biosynthetic protein FliR
MLTELLQGGIYAFLLIFVRVGSAMMIMPAFSEPFISMRIRLTLGLVVTLAVTPLLAETLPPMPESTLMLMLLILSESFIGLFLGFIARSIMSALQTAGMVIAMMTGLANAITQDLTAAEQGSVLGALLTTMGLVIVMALNLHHMLLMVLVDSYVLFVPGQMPMVEDMVRTVAQVVSNSFALGVQLSAPFTALALVFYVGLGIINRLMSSMQIFFIAIPLQILAGLALAMFAIPVMYHWFIRAFEERMIMFLVP